MVTLPRRRRPLAAFLVLAAAGALPALLAVAGPVTDHFEPVLTELNQREAALPVDGLSRDERRQSKALKQAFKAIEKDSDDLGDDLKMAKKVTAAIDRGFAGDATMDALLDDLVAGLAADVEDARDSLDAIVEGLAEGKPRTKAGRSLEKADRFLADVDGQPVRKKQAALLGKALKQVDRGTRAAEKGGAAPPDGDSFAGMTVDGVTWAANDDFGSGVSGLVGVSETSGNVRELRLVLRRILPKGGTSGGIAGASESLRINLIGPATDFDTGTFSLGNNGGISLSVAWIVEDEEGDATTWVGISGSLTLTDLEALLGSGSAAGTFGFTVRDGLTGQTMPLSSGTFEAVNLQRFTVD